MIDYVGSTATDKMNIMERERDLAYRRYELCRKYIEMADWCFSRGLDDEEDICSVDAGDHSFLISEDKAAELVQSELDRILFAVLGGDTDGQ